MKQAAHARPFRGNHQDGDDGDEEPVWAYGEGFREGEAQAADCQKG
jgi:hypothetical protein